MTTPFALDPVLQADSVALGETALCTLRLAKDGRWPWLILVPRRAGVSELHELSAEDLTTLIAEIATASAALKQATACLKVNVAAIGNSVRQLHVHVVARDAGDAGWPGPIWGFGEPEPRTDEVIPTFALAVAEALAATPASNI